jgi:hypothetical protein
MERIERIQLAIERGVTYNPATGQVFGVKGSVIKSKNNYGYIKISLKHNGKYFDLKAHQFAWYVTHGEIVDHIDHVNCNRSDNRICNLRSVTHQQNHFNRAKTKGYTWHEGTQKWRAKIQLNKKSIHLGLFNTEEEARNAYLKGKEQYHII